MQLCANPGSCFHRPCRPVPWQEGFLDHSHICTMMDSDVCASPFVSQGTCALYRRCAFVSCTGWRFLWKSSLNYEQLYRRVALLCKNKKFLLYVRTLVTITARLHVMQNVFTIAWQRRGRSIKTCKRGINFIVYSWKVYDCVVIKNNLNC